VCAFARDLATQIRLFPQNPVGFFPLLPIFPAFTLPAVPASLALRGRLIVPVAVGAYRHDSREQVGVTQLIAPLGIRLIVAVVNNRSAVQSSNPCFC